MDRGERRRRTVEKGRARRDQHLRLVHPNGVLDCACEHSAWMFAKRHGLGCRGCRKRRHGNPKLGWGPCAELVRQAVIERRAGRRLVRAWARVEDLDDGEAQWSSRKRKCR